MELIQIGIIHSPFKKGKGTPVQPKFSGDSEGVVEVYPEFEGGLDDIDGFERIWLIFGAHKARKSLLKVIPYRDTVERGVYSTRSPARPNSICISPVRLVERDGRMLKIAGLDMLDGSPLYDIKPYIPKMDSFPDVKAGWYDEVRGDRENVKEADDRFYKGD
ncbi:tRNA (N6-threonylcarbamoyladenosine(37)-N6)-methyltransferase TrmO [bacterium]|nr:tRNA (N6-threonylcarbamoyladenosine(37)-N6)-methyltransferase TrmO [bacterium]